MAKQESPSTKEQTAQEEVTYTFPEWGIAVKAASYDAAVKKAKALMKEND